MAVCLKCTKTVKNGSYAIKCQTCQQWLHRDCANITIDDFKFYEKELKVTTGRRFHCLACTPKSPNCSFTPSTKKLQFTDTKTDYNEILFTKIKEYIDEHLEIQLQKIKQENENLLNVFKKKCKSLESSLNEVKLAQEKAIKIQNELMEKICTDKTSTTKITRASKSSNTEEKHTKKSSTKAESSSAQSNSNNNSKLASVNTITTQEVAIAVYESAQQTLCDKLININENSDIEQRRQRKDNEDGKNYSDDVMCEGIQNKRNWTTISHRKNRNKRPTKNNRPEPLKGLNDSATSLKVAQKMSFLFLSGLDPEVTGQSVAEYLETKNLKVTNCEKMKTKKSNHHSSFKLTVPYEHREQYLTGDLWPRGVIINHFLNLQRQIKVNH